MFSTEWMCVALWTFAGIFVLTAPVRVSKLVYACTWITLVGNLVLKAINI